MILIYLLLIIYPSIGIGMLFMSGLMNQSIQMEQILGTNYKYKLIFIWPWVVEEIFNHYWK